MTKNPNMDFNKIGPDGGEGIGPEGGGVSDFFD